MQPVVGLARGGRRHKPWQFPRLGSRYSGGDGSAGDSGRAGRAVRTGVPGWPVAAGVLPRACAVAPVSPVRRCRGPLESAGGLWLSSATGRWCARRRCVPGVSASSAALSTKVTAVEPARRTEKRFQGSEVSGVVTMPPVAASSVVFIEHPEPFRQRMPKDPDMVPEGPATGRRRDPDRDGQTGPLGAQMILEDAGPFGSEARRKGMRTVCAVCVYRFKPFDNGMICASAQADIRTR